MSGSGDPAAGLQQQAGAGESVTFDLLIHTDTKVKVRL